ncbi:hypothetical protein Z950_2968 [Sulfitobacter mediterraneus KCTC 32188]|nr:hypothetical protein Z950_2968 [Sulfitobacter mediterraneus KCTC 32188]
MNESGCVGHDRRLSQPPCHRQSQSLLDSHLRIPPQMRP